MSFWNGISRIAPLYENIIIRAICRALQKEYTAKGVIWLSIDSSAPGEEGNYPAEKLNEFAAQDGAARTALLLDPAGDVGRLYGAKTTPDMYVIDTKGILVYKGAIDNKRSTDLADVKIATNYVKGALDAVMAGKDGPYDRDPTVRLQRQIRLKMNVEFNAHNRAPEFVLFLLVCSRLCMPRSMCYGERLFF